MNAPLPNRYRIKSPDGVMCALAELSADHSQWIVRVYRRHYGFPGPIDRFTVEAFPSSFRTDRGLLGVSRETRLRHGITGTWHPINTEDHAK